MDPQWPAADFDVDEQKRRLVDEAPIDVIPTVAVTRYVTPLREGGSLPGIVEADDLGTYVCKFRGAGQGLRVLVAEVIVAGLAERIGLRTPRLVALDLDPAIARYEADEEVQDLLNASPGLNLGVDFLPGSFGFDGHVPPAPTGERSIDPVRVLWLDAFVANVDRSWRNPNLLLWHGNLWVIDHGAALYFHHGWSGGVGDPERFAAPALERGRPRVPRARGRAARHRRRAPRLPGRGGVRRGAGRGARRVARAGPRRRDPEALRAAYVDFLTARLGTAQWLPAGSGMTAPSELKLAYQYVVLRCVPRVDREEFLNVGVVLYCQAADFLDVAWRVDRDRLRALDPRVDVDQVCEALAFVDARLRRPPDRRCRGRRAADPAVRLPQGPALDRPPARPRPRRRHRRPRPPARAPPRTARRLALTRRDCRRTRPTVETSRLARRRQSTGQRQTGTSSTAPTAYRARMARASSGWAPSGSETATAPASRASSAARSGRKPGARNSEATAMWRRPSAAERADGLAGGRRCARGERRGDRQLVVRAPDPGQPGDGLVGERVAGAGRGQHQRVELADPGGLERLAQPHVEHLEERRLEAEDRGGADRAPGGAGRTASATADGTSTLAW